MNIKKEKERLLNFLLNNAKQDYTDLPCAMRDALTDMMSICKDEGINFNEKVASAEEVLQIEEFLERTKDEDYDGY